MRKNSWLLNQQQIKKTKSRDILSWLQMFNDLHDINQTIAMSVLNFKHLPNDQKIKVWFV